MGVEDAHASIRAHEPVSKVECLAVAECLTDEETDPLAIPWMHSLEKALVGRSKLSRFETIHPV